VCVVIPLNDAEIFDCVTRLADVNDRISELQRQGDALKVILRALGPQQRRRFGDLTLTVSPNRRFDGAKARNVLTPQDYERICVAKPDPTAAREVLPGDLYAACCTDGEMIVRLS
jgi:hypothetical protein